MGRRHLDGAKGPVTDKVMMMPSPDAGGAFRGPWIPAIGSVLGQRLL
jgi:hypothetical protein